MTNVQKSTIRQALVNSQQAFRDKYGTGYGSAPVSLQAQYDRETVLLNELDTCKVDV